MKAEYSLPHEEKELFFYNVSRLRSAEALFGGVEDSDLNGCQEESLYASAGASEDFARSAGYSVVGGEGASQVSRTTSTCERIRRKYSRLCAVERSEPSKKFVQRYSVEHNNICGRTSEARFNYMDAGASEADRQVVTWINCRAKSHFSEILDHFSAV